MTLSNSGSTVGRTYNYPTTYHKFKGLIPAKNFGAGENVRENKSFVTNVSRGSPIDRAFEYIS